jgi:hypothetical protein
MSDQIFPLIQATDVHRMARETKISRFEILPILKTERDDSNASLEQIARRNGLQKHLNIVSDFSDWKIRNAEMRLLIETYASDADGELYSILVRWMTKFFPLPPKTA